MILVLCGEMGRPTAAFLLLFYSCCSCLPQLGSQAVGYYGQQDGGLDEDDSYASSMDDFPIDTAESQETGTVQYALNVLQQSVHPQSIFTPIEIRVQ